MQKTEGLQRSILKRTAAAVLLALLFAGCNNFLHELVPPDDNRIVSFSLPGQLGPAAIGENDISVTVGPGVDIGNLIPRISLPDKASLIPITLPYIQKAFPSFNLFQDGMALYTSQDQANYVIDLIKQNKDFTVPVLDEAIDFSAPVLFLVVSGLGSVRQYSVRVTVDTGEGKILSFGFPKFNNPELTRGDAAVTLDDGVKTIGATVWYPVENIGSFKLVPVFETNGAAVSCGGAILSSGTGVIDFGPKPGAEGWGSETRSVTLTVQRPGFAPTDYILTVTFKEDPDTIRSLIDFRFEAGINYGIKYTAMGEIVNTGDTGTVTVKVHYTGAVPASLTPHFVSPGTVSVGGASQTSGLSSHDFTLPVDYKVVARSGTDTRIYTVTVEFVNDVDSRPRITGFVFTTAANGGLASGTQAMITHDPALIVIEAVYGGAVAPVSLVPEFTAGGTVRVNGVVQQSGTSAQDFSHKVKYTVFDPGNPGLFRDYWVEVRFTRHSLSLAEISEFRFMAADNPGLCADVTAVINQSAGTITAILPFNGPPPAGAGHRALYPRWLAQGTVTAGGIPQTSGASGMVFGPTVTYRVVSSDGVFHKDYAVTVRELNTRIYVDKDATGDNTGVSWANAFKSLMDACAASEHLPPALSAEIWIAEGTYRPSETGDGAAYFPVRGNTGYYGGFAGTETAKTSRVPGHPVVITGELGGGVYAGPLFMNDDLQRRNAAFDGMTFTKAKALTGVYPYTCGAAISVLNANSVTITNAVFEDLQAGSSGGAVHAFSSSGSVTIEDCEFSDTETEYGGGAVHVSGGASVTIIKGCDFTNTKSERSYGGAVGASGSVTITDCGFTSTKAGSYGGAVHASGSVTIRGCDFEDNEAGLSGGAVHAYTSTSGSVTIRDCGFTNTEARDYNGGAVYAEGPTITITITDCDFTSTKAGSNGGAVAYSSSGSVTIRGCDFTNTEARSYNGGAIYANDFHASVTIEDCDFEDNEAGLSGGAVYADCQTITINDYTSNNTRAGDSGGSLYIAARHSVSLSNAQISGSQAVNTASIYPHGGGGIYIVGGTASPAPVALSGITFDTVAVSGSAPLTLGGAVYFGGNIDLAMTGCSIAGASSSAGGGAIAGIGQSSCTLNGVSFSGCSALQGSLLYGNSDAPGIGPAYVVGPGCSVDGTPITVATWMLMASRVYLPYGSIMPLMP
jgi:hypothetical protein